MPQSKRDSSMEEGLEVQATTSASLDRSTSVQGSPVVTASIVDEMAETSLAILEGLETGSILELGPLRDALRSVELLQPHQFRVSTGSTMTSSTSLPSPLARQQSSVSPLSGIRHLEERFATPAEVRLAWPVLIGAVQSWIAKRVGPEFEHGEEYTKSARLVQQQCRNALRERLGWSPRAAQRSEFVATLTRARQLALQTALHHRYPLLSSEGCASMSRPPVVYVGDRSTLLSVLERTCWELLLSPHSFQVVPLRTIKSKPESEFSSLQLDIEALQRQIALDKAKGNLPVAVLASVNMGEDRDRQLWMQVDDILALRNVCDASGMWLHVDGNALDLYLAAASECPPLTSLALECADSLCAQPLPWFGMHGELTVVILDPKHGGGSVSGAPGRDPSSSAVPEGMPPLNTLLGFWIASTLGDERSLLNESVDHLLDICSALILNAEQPDFVLTLGPFPDAIPHRLLLRVRPKLDLSELHLDLDTFNAVLAARLQDTTSAALGIRRAVHNGMQCMVFCPSGLDYSSHMTVSDIERFLQNIGQEVRDLHMALEARPLLEQAIDNNDELYWIKPERFADYVGIGAFRLVPMFVERKDEASRELALNELNLAFAKNLATKDNVFQSVVTIDDQVCVSLLALPRVGPQHHDPTQAVAHALDLIEHTAGRLEMPPALLALAAESLQQGIEEAERKIRHCVDSLYTPDALIRSIPVVGSVFSWVLPGQEPSASEISVRRSRR